jgi:hypothetical protein
MDGMPKKTANDYMQMPMKDYPQVLKEYLMYVSLRIGWCGDVNFECCKAFVEAGEPESSFQLIYDFAKGLSK